MRTRVHRFLTPEIYLPLSTNMLKLHGAHVRKLGFEETPDYDFLRDKVLRRNV